MVAKTLTISFFSTAKLLIIICNLVAKEGLNIKIPTNGDVFAKCRYLCHYFL